LWLFGWTIFCNSSGNYVDKVLIQYARAIADAELGQILGWSWGSAVLNATYRGLCQACFKTERTADIIGPSQTYDASGALQVHSPRMTRSHQHLLRLVLTVLQMHSRTRRATYADGLGLEGEDEESARFGTGGVDTPDSVDSIYLNCFCMYYFIFNRLMYRTIVIFVFYVAKCYRLTIFI
jgi:hypothetical protein